MFDLSIATYFHKIHKSTKIYFRIYPIYPIENFRDIKYLNIYVEFQDKLFYQPSSIYATHFKFISVHVAQEFALNSYVYNQIPIQFSEVFKIN